MDDRFEWLVAGIRRSLHVDQASTTELLSNDSNVATITGFFDDASLCVLSVVALDGDVFETNGQRLLEDDSDDGGDGAVKYQKIVHQRLQLVGHLSVPKGDDQSVRSVCFLKTSPVAVTVADASGWNAGPVAIDTVVERLVTGAPDLQAFQTSLVDVFLPMIEDVPRAKRNEGRQSEGLNTLSSEVVTAMHRLNTHMASFLNQLSVERSLPMPSNPIPIEDSDAGINAAVSNDDVVKDIDATVSLWQVEIQSALDQEPAKEGPLGEIEYWKQKYSALSGLYEQLQQPKVKLILRVAQQAECSSWQTISTKITDLIRKHTMAKDNVKFLNTLDRHFRTIHGVTPESGTLQPIIDTMNSMMTAVRMVWIISRYYCTEENMMGLLEKIAALIAQKVSQFIDHHTFLSLPFDEARRRIEQGQQTLLKWKSAYMQVQKDINESEREQHWVFDNKRLFDTTDYMADRCTELLEIVNVLDYYYKLLGAQLKQVLTEQQGIDRLLKEVEKARKSIESMSFDPFDRKAIHNWEMMHNSFQTQVASIDHQVSVFLQKVFDDDLRSAESAFTLLQSFKKLQSRGSDTILDIKKLLQTKADKILEQFEHEIDRVESIFLNSCDNPPLTKNQPPVAGSIHWSTSLYQRLKKPIMRFQEEDMLVTQAGQRVKKRYIEVAKKMKDYATARFDDWKAAVKAKTGEYLKWHVLREEGTEAERVYVVNFNTTLFQIIKEAKYLDRLGYDIPPEALNVTLQDEAYHNYVESIKVMLTSFNNELANVSGPERQIMQRPIAQLKNVLKPGLEDLNWFFLGIPDFIKRCMGEITDFRNLSREVRKHAETIQRAVNTIATTQLVPDASHFAPAPGTTELHDLQKVTDIIERHRAEQVDNCLRLFETIPQILKNIEELTDTGAQRGPARAATGKSQLLANYYRYWEKKICEALRRMVVNGLTRLASLLGHRARGSRKPRPPLFRISIMLAGQEPLYQPQDGEIRGVLQKLQGSIIETTKLFPRWMDGTCVKYTEGVIEPATATKEDSPDNLFTHHSDIAVDPNVFKLQAWIQRAFLQRSLAQAGAQVNQLTGYRPVYSSEKHLSVEALRKEDHPWLVLRTKIHIQHELMAVHSIERPVDLGFMRADTTAFYREIVRHLGEWIDLEGRELSNDYNAKVKVLTNRITNLSHRVHGECNDIEQLKAVLEAMDDSRTSNAEIELQFREIEFVYDTLLRYGIRVADEEKEAAYGLRERWSRLMDDVRLVDNNLTSKKVGFRKQTQEAVRAFLLNTKASLADFRAKGPSRASIDLDEGSRMRTEWDEKVDKMVQERTMLVKSEKLFGLDMTLYPSLHTLEEELKRVGKVYDLYDSWMEHLRKWEVQPWGEVRIDDMADKVEKKRKEANQLKKTHEQVEPFKDVQEKIKSFYDSLDLLRNLKSDALKPRHWTALMKITKSQFNYERITLKDLVEMEVYKYTEEISEVVETAAREAAVERDIQSIKDFWAQKEFALFPYPPKTEKPRCHVLGDTSEIQEAVDENIMKIQSIANVKWAQPFAEDVRIWERKLATINDVIQVWVVVQVKWQYLESIFKGSEDIAVQLPKETVKFNDLDNRWVSIMKDTVNTSNVEAACNAADRLGQLRLIEKGLDECQRDLTNYLESKRCLFPRFYFISDDELLSILASSSPRSVQEHMLKMFDNSKMLRFKGDSDVVEGVESQEGERLDFDNNVNVEGKPVEEWLLTVLQESRRSLRTILKAGVFYYPTIDRLEFVKRYHGMLTLCGCKIWWTFQIEDAFAKVKKGKKSAVKELSVKLSTQLYELVTEMEKDLSKQYRKKINTLIIVDVHGRDIVDRFVRDSVLDPREFDWESQLRFYWDKPSDTCVIRQCTGEFNFGYEYMGLNGRLVITPLTDRCFMTLTQALTFYLGGAPGGPAGTGKTESVKDLAKAMSLHCVVFNCGEGLDYKAMASIFSGLSQSGSWGCFDEFNRIELPVLSVVSEQLRSIQYALKNKQTRFVFSDKEIALDANVGVFITMNPGYAGRVELPDNLKALFRPVVMVVPDMALIAENMLFSEGFHSARELAQKMVTLYALARGQLSRQFHYDWGLRALKAVLVMAGALKRGSPDLDENAVLMRALRDMNAPKFVAEDEPLFKGLISDLFPGLDPTRVPQQNLAQAAGNALKARRLQPDERQKDKIVQLYETMQTRHTTMVVGPTGGGKTVVINALCEAQDELKLPTRQFIINPKAQPTTVLYGVLDPMTRNWTDGIFSSVFRNINRPSEKEGADRERKYVVFDGDVDAKWVEDLNSVMDDNKLLTLPNGERIRLNPTCSILFEVGDLQYASPATVSRVGMVYLDPANLGWRPFATSWCEKRNKEEAEAHGENIDKYVRLLLQFVLEGINDDVLEKPPRLVLPTTELNLVRQLCTMLNTIIPRAVPEPKILECLFIFSCVWSFGSLIDTPDDRARFDVVLKKATNWQTQDNGEDLSRYISAGTLPEQRTMYDYFFDLTDNKWKPWQVLVTPFVRPVDGKFSSMLVPTVDTERGMWLLDKLVHNRTPVMFVGETGTAKTVTIQTYLKVLKNTEKKPNADGEVPLEEMLVELNFSSRTSSLDAQRTLEDNVEKRTTTVLGPPAKKRLLVFVDDINMPKVDLYGTQQPIAFLKYLIEQGSWYDRKDLLCKQVRDTQFLAAMAPPGGGRNALDPRFVSLFTVFNIANPAETSLRTIYTQILESQYESISTEVQGMASNFVSMLLKLYKHITDTMPATPAKFHYIFNLRDLSRVAEGLCRATVDKFSSEEGILRLWRNEVLRVFSDRMSDVTDKQSVSSIVSDLIRDQFPSHAEYALADPLLFGDFGDFEPESEKPRLHLYEDFGPDYTVPRGLLESMLEEVNTPIVKMDLVMFDMAIDHLLRVIRVLSTPRGHALLVGVGGSGKQSLTKLAAIACQMSVYEIVLSRGYNEDAFREDLKRLFTRCGGADREKTVFLFMDSHVKQEGFLELVNNMLTSGMVPALFSEEEREPLYSTVLAELAAQKINPTKENKWNAFLAHCRDNLHIVLSMSPSGDTLRTRCRNFPGLINNTTIDWFDKWPAQALHAVGAKFLANEVLPSYLRESIVDHVVQVHMISDELAVKFQRQLKRNNFVTPKNFLAFLSQYARLLQSKRQNVDEIVAKLKTGLERLQKASEDVAVMSTELAAKKIDLSAKTTANKAMLDETNAMKTETEAKAKDAQQAEEELMERNVVIERDSEDAEKILAEAQPILEAATKAVSQLDQAAITELKAFANPSKKVVAVVEMICHLWPTNPGKKASWDIGKGIMSQSNFLTTVRNFPTETLNEGKMKEVRRTIEDNKGLTADDILKASRAAADLFKWVSAVMEYWDVYKIVKPKQEAVAKLKASKEALEKSLALTKNEIEYLNETVRGLTERLEAGEAEAARLQAETDTMQRRLNAAHRLLNGFTSERQRWQVEKGELNNTRNYLVGDCLIGAAFMSYLGAFTFPYREEAVMKHWIPDLEQKEVPMTKPFKLQSLMTNEVEISRWASDGLPGDELSVQNGILTVESTPRTESSGDKKKKAAERASSEKKKVAKIRFPLCIDPQMQAVNWIKRRNAANSAFEVATFNDADFLKRLEFAIQYGNPFLFENVDEFIDPIIDSILDPVFREENGQRLVRLGDKEIAWDDNFQLYLCTKLSNPAYPAEVFGKTLVINYSVTQDGLESQLLNYVVASERADIQRQSEELVQTMAENKAQLKILEDTLIRELTLATGNILDNEELISTLESTKSSASEVTIKLQQAEETARSTEEYRQAYRPVAKRGAILFFAIAQLSSVNSMYEYSLTAFLHDVFKVSLEKSETAFDTEPRLNNINEYLTYCVYRYVCMGIFERHKLMYSLLLTIRLMAGVGELPTSELEFFLKGCLIPQKSFPSNPCGFLTDRQWNDICQLAISIDVFEKLPQQIADNTHEWEAWYVLDRPEDVDELPSGYKKKTPKAKKPADDDAEAEPEDATGVINAFQKLCLLRCFRVDRVYTAITHFIGECPLTGKNFTVPPIVKYEDVYKQSSSLSPIVCIVSPGANPTDEIVKLADKREMTGRLKSISLGQGQGDEAMRMVDAGAVRGHWVLLQNCHLLVTWMKELEKIVEKRDQNKPHQDFRLWLTTEPSPEFPLGILQRSLKVVNEPPNGLKMNMKNTFSKFSEEALENCPHSAFRPLVYTLSFFHAVVQERRKYGKIGWNVVYDFNETDATISMALIDTYLTKADRNGDPIPWPTLRYLVGEAMYGGRVTDSMDRRIVNAYLEEYFGDFLFDTFQPFAFYAGDFKYDLPAGSTDPTKPILKETMVAHIDEFPNENAPDVFGLHVNAETGYLRSATESLWANLIDLMPRSTVAGASGGTDNVLMKLTNDILDKIPEQFERKEIMKAELEKARANKHDNLQPTQVVLLQELERWNNLVVLMVITLKNLQKALRGIIGMSADLDELAGALSNGQLPAAWRKKAPETRKNLGRWLVHFESRYDQYRRWVEVGEPNCMWLAGLMIPESYVSALVQITCRKYTWPLDRSTVFTRVTNFKSPDEIKAPPKDGAYVHGLFLEGAKWDHEKGCLSPQEKKVLIYDLPVLEIIPQETSKLKLVGTFRTPVYVTRDRRNAAGVGLVMEADLASDKHPSHWILESVALILNSDD